MNIESALRLRTKIRLWVSTHLTMGEVDDLRSKRGVIWS